MGPRGRCDAVVTSPHHQGSSGDGCDALFDAVPQQLGKHSQEPLGAAADIACQSGPAGPEGFVHGALSQSDDLTPWAALAGVHGRSDENGSTGEFRGRGEGFDHHLGSHGVAHEHGVLEPFGIDPLRDHACETADPERFARVRDAVEAR